MEKENKNLTKKLPNSTGLALLREPFAPHQISKLPKPLWKKESYANYKPMKCDICGGYHPKEGYIHLDYVGHAALTDRLLDCDPLWNWEPMALNAQGLPLIIDNQMWIILTVCGKSVYGFGDAQGKTGANAVKEIIGDALRNGAMRLGAALNLWHKGDLHIEGALIDGETGEVLLPAETTTQKPRVLAMRTNWKAEIEATKTISKLLEWIADNKTALDSDRHSDSMYDMAINHAKDLLSAFDDVETMTADYKFNKQQLTNLKLDDIFAPLYGAQKANITAIAVVE